MFKWGRRLLYVLSFLHNLLSEKYKLLSTNFIFIKFHFNQNSFLVVKELRIWNCATQYFDWRQISVGKNVHTENDHMWWRYHLQRKEAWNIMILILRHLSRSWVTKFYYGWCQSTSSSHLSRLFIRNKTLFFLEDFFRFLSEF